MQANRVVYFHLRPDTNELFYIGMGLRKRAFDFSTRKNKQWKKIVESYGKPIVIIVAENLTPNEAVEIEKFWIKHHGLHRLTNVSPGGDGVLGFYPSQESRDKMSKTRKGRKLSEEHKEKLRAALIGRKRPKEVVDKIAKINTGKKRSDLSKENMRNSHIGAKLSEEHKENIRKGMLAIHRSKRQENRLPF